MKKSRRPLVRLQRDTNDIWGDLAREDSVDTSVWLRRGITRFVFVVGTVALTTAAAFFAWQTYTLNEARPNAQAVIDLASRSTFEVECENSLGTGVAVRMPLPDGYRTAVLSVAHVFDECEAGDTVKLRQNGSTIFGKLISKDPKTVPSDDDYRNDVALIYLRKEIPALDPAPPAQIGDWALILGNPWDRINYATMGIISAVNNDEYETDAAANEGNSGGPLLDSKARVLGLVSYAPLQEDVNSDDPAHNFKTASGIVAAKRLVVTCANLFLDSTSCPFRY